MNEREKSIAMAAIRVYTRNGVKRTTMTDIAREANVTRQTVYNAFHNTDAVLRAAIRLYVDQQWNMISEGWRKTDRLDEKLDVLFRHFIIDTWEVLNSTKEAAELAGGYNAEGRAEIDLARARYRDDIAALFDHAKDRLEAKGIDPHSVSDLISFSSEGIKFSGKTLPEVTAAVATLKALVLSLVEPV